MKKNRMSALLLAAATTLASAQPLIDGEVRKVDAAQNRITLKHGEIKHLDMPPMSMVFQVQDPALLAKVKAGDKVRFSVDRIDGVYTVTAIESAR
ncbi:RND transporter [Methylibium sp. Pch-M]|uniref:copper-binding protein n=1 Tax=Methylibium sp. Pch-M TaxID=2082386 RepID=UPI0010130253|nr:copper-binding protein [Methylibium sp. Pch-M]QAZ40017.1 RND transporter [Methylibium sp. Pch-M]